MGEALLMNHRRKKKSEGLKYYDTFTTIGATETIDGATYNEAGYFGTVSANELFTGTELASAVGITQGIVQHDNIEWLKFYIDGKIIFRPMKAIRHSLSWDTINLAGCVDGSTILAKSGVNFKVRLIKGSTENPANISSDVNTMKYSEWNRLLLPINELAEKKTWRQPYFVEDDVSNWNINFTNTDLNIPVGNAAPPSGGAVWCQELISEAAALVRGSIGESYAAGQAKTNRQIMHGWCPILEAVSPTE